ncbi:MAG: hypothetical protein PVH07_09815 [Chloroflexota bacterium]|jgi:hypothetical protein
MSQPQGAPRDRRVVLTIVLLVVGLLLASLVSALVPGIDATLAALPVVVVLLVVGTVLVLARSWRGSRS